MTAALPVLAPFKGHARPRTEFTADGFKILDASGRVILQAGRLC